MAKRKARSQIANLTPDHYKSIITLISLCLGDVQHIVGKIWMKAYNFTFVSAQSEV
jgi:hypothetical protein